MLSRFCGQQIPPRNCISLLACLIVLAEFALCIKSILPPLCPLWGIRPPLCPRRVGWGGGGVYVYIFFVISFVASIFNGIHDMTNRGCGQRWGSAALRSQRMPRTSPPVRFWACRRTQRTGNLIWKLASQKSYQTYICMIFFNGARR